MKRHNDGRLDGRLHGFSTTELFVRRDRLHLRPGSTAQTWPWSRECRDLCLQGGDPEGANDSTDMSLMLLDATAKTSVTIMTINSCKMPHALTR